ncbi:hypothetical protein M0804_001807 [Polistes exclamans]|nr:hypothetical protein M0804_001807 [Polistes exclamans]
MRVECGEAVSTALSCGVGRQVGSRSGWAALSGPFDAHSQAMCYVLYGDLANHTLLSHRRHPALFARFDEANSRFAFAFAFAFLGRSNLRCHPCDVSVEKQMPHARRCQQQQQQQQQQEERERTR